MHEGIREALGGGGITLEFQYVDLDEAPDAETLEKWGTNAAEKAQAFNPDIVIVLNDEAVMHVAINIDDVDLVELARTPIRRRCILWYYSIYRYRIPTLPLSNYTCNGCPRNGGSPFNSGPCPV